MLASPSSHALLARSSIRTVLATSAPRTIPARPTLVAARCLSSSVVEGTASRTLTTSAVQRQAVVSDFVDPAASVPAAAESKKSTVPSASTPTGGRRLARRGRALTLPQQVRLLLKWSWLFRKPGQRDNLVSRVDANGSVNLENLPDWFHTEFELARSYRSARARLWIPTASEASAFTDKSIDDVGAWIEELIDDHQGKLEARPAEEGEENEELLLWETLERQEKIDLVLRPVWRHMSDEQREAALLRVRYECIRKLGWRYGYSSGYPQPPKLNADGKVDATAHLPEGLGKPGKEGLEALRQLRERDEAAAWAAWQKMPSSQRVAEEKAAWGLRDRSQIYLDDSEDCMVLGATASRWFEVPERAGELTFLPNTIVRLVKNHTPAGQAYDPWKATFRVPLNMHKHALRSYLLSIYGLKTTWARSSIYRSPVTREARTGKAVSGKGRTWKKVEVGLLEPFLFPEVSPEFKTKELMQSELDYERARVFMKITKTSRWRSKKSLDEYTREIRNAEDKTYDGLAVDEVLRAVGDKQQSETDKFPRFMVRAQGVPSAKHGKILKLLAQKRQEKENAVDALVQQYKADATVAANGNGQ
ncbi:hypothetical protein ACQY0O_006216 [Thecaphora frezii]